MRFLMLILIGCLGLFATNGFRVNPLARVTDGRKVIFVCKQEGKEMKCRLEKEKRFLSTTTNQEKHTKNSTEEGLRQLKKAYAKVIQQLRVDLTNIEKISELTKKHLNLAKHYRKKLIMSPPKHMERSILTHLQQLAMLLTHYDMALKDDLRQINSGKFHANRNALDKPLHTVNMMSLENHTRAYAFPSTINIGTDLKKMSSFIRPTHVFRNAPSTRTGRAANDVNKQLHHKMVNITCKNKLQGGKVASKYDINEIIRNLKLKKEKNSSKLKSKLHRCQDNHVSGGCAFNYSRSVPSDFKQKLKNSWLKIYPTPLTYRRKQSLAFTPVLSNVHKKIITQSQTKLAESKDQKNKASVTKESHRNTAFLVATRVQSTDIFPSSHGTSTLFVNAPISTVSMSTLRKDHFLQDNSSKIQVFSVIVSSGKETTDGRLLDGENEFSTVKHQVFDVDSSRRFQSSLVTSLFTGLHVIPTSHFEGQMLTSTQSSSSLLSPLHSATVLDTMEESLVGTRENKNNIQDSTTSSLFPSRSTTETSSSAFRTNVTTTPSAPLLHIKGKNFLVRFNLLQKFNTTMLKANVKTMIEKQISELYASDDTFTGSKVSEFSWMKRENVTAVDVELYFNSRNNAHLDTIQKQLASGVLGPLTTGKKIADVSLLNDNIQDINWCLPPCIAPYKCFPSCERSCCDLTVNEEDRSKKLPSNFTPPKTWFSNPFYAVYNYIFTPDVPTSPPIARPGDYLIRNNDISRFNAETGQIYCNPICRKFCLPACLSQCCRSS